ncbi:MAG: FliI/YscN family ATPase [Ottowia sp.]|nr:FliI/YscN family ATPase [Ottowia sp.]
MAYPIPNLDETALYKALTQSFHLRDMPSGQGRFGRITELNSTLVTASLPGVALGEVCMIEPANIEAEVIQINGNYATLSPFSLPTGLMVGNLVRPLGHAHHIALGAYLQGSILDGLGRLLRGHKPDANCIYRTLDGHAPDPLTRKVIDSPLTLGVRAIDGILTCGVGQRIGIFAAAGGGKSTLLGMICDGTQADVIVLGLIGERGREVRHFLEHNLSPEALARTVVVVATSDRPALERLKAAYTATVIAEYFRDQGKNVLLMMDSLTRFARAAREIGLAAGEPPTAGSFPPSLYAHLPRLLERAGPSDVGSITGLYTVLVEGDNINEPLADEVRSILDGHIVLSRKLAQANHYPAIDINGSVSRVMNQIVSPQQVHLAGHLRQLLSTYQEVEFLVRVGEYQAGQDALSDEAIARRDAIAQFLCQGVGEKPSFDETLAALEHTLGA